MKVEVLKGGWIKQGSVIAYPHDWQRPAKTEEWIYEKLIEKKVNSRYVEFISFPWATLIDSIKRERIKKVKELIDTLKNIPVKKTLFRATACQHIDITEIIFLLREIGVTDLFWSHKTQTKSRFDNLRIHLLPLYPVSFYLNRFNNIKPLTERRYIYSFVGAVNLSSYISNVRESILKYKDRSNSLILERDEWHFENDVYGDNLTEQYKQDSNEKMSIYNRVLEDTIYSLCPSGSGPNTIRYWESLAFGAIPVVLSDDFDENGLFGGAVKIKEEYLEKKINEIEFELKNHKLPTLAAQSLPEEWIERLIMWIFNDNKKLIMLAKG